MATSKNLYHSWTAQVMAVIQQLFDRYGPLFKIKNNYTKSVALELSFNPLNVFSLQILSEAVNLHGI